MIPIITEEAHAKLSPSASDRWLECGVAPSREALVADKTSAAAQWGTDAHALAEHCLTNNIAPWDVKGAGGGVADCEDTEMNACVQEYIEFVRNKQGVSGHLFVEQKLQIFPEYGVWGTADSVVVGHEIGLMDVIDLKGGIGVLVEAETSNQLKLYAWGAYQSLEWLSATEIDRVRVSIVQPRRSHVVSKTFTVEELKAWVVEALPKVKRAYGAEGEGVPGAHCLWCRVKAKCPERAEFMQASAMIDFAAPDSVPKVNDMPDEWLVEVFKAMPLIRQYLKDVETYVADLAHETGKAPAGLKWVGGRVTLYIYDKEHAAEALRRVGVQPYEEPSMLGITALEKALKAKGLKFSEVLGAFTQIKKSDPVLVSEADKRAPYDPNAGAAEDFG